MALKRLGWAAASLGPKPGAKSSLAMLLQADDLSGAQWRTIDERTWRSGSTDKTTDWARRARDIQSVTAWRSFEDRASERSLWTQVTPLASPDDARQAVADLPAKFLGNLRADVTVVTETEVQSPQAEGVSNAWSYEQTTTGPRGAGVSLYSAGTVGSVVTVLAASGLVDAWKWSDVYALTQIQAARIEASTSA